MSRHTPGPWDLIGPIRKISGGEPFYVVYADDVQIVRLKLEANARLIAAAPELLEALKRAKDLFRELMRDEVLDEPTVEDFATFDAIDDAIAKAEGYS